MRQIITRATSDNLQACPRPEPVEITVNDKAATREMIFFLGREKGLNMVERSEWGAKPGKSGMAPDWDYTMIAIHHAGRSFACSSGVDQMTKIQSHHHSQEYDDIGYHFGIDCAGVIYEGRDIRLKGSSLIGYNTGVIGIVLLEDMTTAEEGRDAIATARVLMENLGLNTQSTIPKPQTDSLKILVSVLKDLFLINTLGGHREFPNQQNEGKICPGNLGIQVVELIRIEANLSAPAQQ